MPSLGDWTTCPIYNDHANNPWNDKEFDLLDYVEMSYDDEELSFVINDFEYKVCDYELMKLMDSFVTDRTEKYERDWAKMVEFIETKGLTLNQIFDKHVQFDDEEFDTDMVREVFVNEFNELAPYLKEPFFFEVAS